MAPRGSSVHKHPLSSGPSPWGGRALPSSVGRPEARSRLQASRERGPFPSFQSLLDPGAAVGPELGSLLRGRLLRPRRAGPFRRPRSAASGPGRGSASNRRSGSLSRPTTVLGLRTGSPSHPTACVRRGPRGGRCARRPRSTPSLVPPKGRSARGEASGSRSFPSRGPRSGPAITAGRCHQGAEGGRWWGSGNWPACTPRSGPTPQLTRMPGTGGRS